MGDFKSLGFLTLKEEEWFLDRVKFDAFEMQSRKTYLKLTSFGRRRAKIKEASVYVQTELGRQVQFKPDFVFLGFGVQYSLRYLLRGGDGRLVELLEKID